MNTCKISIYMLGEDEDGNLDKYLVDSKTFEEPESGDDVELLRGALARMNIHLELIEDDERIPDWRVFIRERMKKEDNVIILEIDDYYYMLEIY